MSILGDGPSFKPYCSGRVCYHGEIHIVSEVEEFVEFVIFGNIPTTHTIWKHRPPNPDSWCENHAP